jgi:heptosyltransferase-2
VRLPNWIGDAVMAEPALSALAQAFPDDELWVLARPGIVELLECHPAITRAIPYDHRGRHAGIAGKWALARELRRLSFRQAVLFQNAFEAALLTWLAGIPKRYGYATDGRVFLLTDPVAVPDRSRHLHQVNYFYGMLSGLGIHGMPPRPRLFLSKGEQAGMADRLRGWGIAERDVVVGINPGSVYGGAKRWFPERFAEAADRIAQEVGPANSRVVIVGGPGEERLAEAIARHMRAEPLILSGRTTVRELMAVVRRCNVFLTNDTGPMHIASAFDVPLVAIFGPTDWRETAPFDRAHAVVRRSVDCSPCLLRECPIDHRCMTGVTVDEVSAAALNQLSTPGLPAQHPVLSTQHSLLSRVTVFLDRDGTINREPGGYVTGPEKLEMIPGSAQAIARLNRSGIRVVLVTNQSGIGRGLFTVGDLERIHLRLLDELAQAGARLDAVYFCPHHPDDGCRCRKPETLMVDRAVEELAVDLCRAYVVGDQTRDIHLAQRVGAKGVLVLTGPNSRDAKTELESARTPPVHVAADLAAAVTWILDDAGRELLRTGVSPETCETTAVEGSAYRQTGLKWGNSW